MLRTNIIQALIDKHNYSSYLEIGLGLGVNFNSVVVDEKVSVDPNQEYGAIYKTTSDEYFLENEKQFDIILVDGLHHADQVYKDIQNSLDVLKEGGTIVCHDMNPIKEEHQVIPFAGGHWNGDCWKALVELRKNHTDLKVYTVDTDEGCAVIQRVTSGTEKFKTDLELTWENFDKNRKQWLNLISSQEFLNKMGTQITLKDLIKKYIADPDNPEINWQCALYYHTIGQTAPAVGYYIRAAERTEDTLLQYECMVRASMCFDTQGIRKFSVKGMLQHAVALYPDRPEAYYLLGKILSNEYGDGSWFDSYTYSTIGVKLSKPVDELPALRTNVDYPGIIGLELQQAIAAWHTGMCDESRELHKALWQREGLPADWREVIKNNLTMMNGFVTNTIEPFKRANTSELMHRFANVDTIHKNFSESFQDIFVLSMLDGKQDGTYLEIGAGNAFYGNNTALLEQHYNWTGISFDINEDFVKDHNEHRRHTCLRRDATTVDYTKMLPALGFDKTVDYLQIDCDPPEVSFQVLLTIPFEEYKFAVITFEHDHYANTESDVRDKSRKYLESHGYKLVVNNIAPDDWRAYEDWWVHPDLVDAKLIDKFTLVNDNVKKAKDYMLGKLK